MVPNTGIKASSPRDETHPQNMTATCFLSSQQIKCGTCFLSYYKYFFCHITSFSPYYKYFFNTTIVSSEGNNVFQSSFVQFLFS